MPQLIQADFESEVAALKTLIHGFIQQRLQLKLEKLGDTDHDKRQQLLQGHLVDVWLQDAARRVGQIQLVNFGLKFTHPDARGSSLYLQQPVNAPHLVGTHSLGKQSDDDVVGNAAALDVYKFLKVEHAGASLLRRAIDADEALAAALSGDTEQSKAWMQAFAAIVHNKGPLASHTLAKQIYFPLEGGSYHLLSPLFPTSLVQRVYQQIERDRFSDEAKAARQARRDKRFWPDGFSEYPNLLTQNFGGTKPQNISQLNSERRGKNFLLPSLPPNWQVMGTKAPMHQASVFISAFPRRRAVRKLCDSLRNFLDTTAHNNLAIRQTRQRLLEGICDELVQFAAETQALPPGWSSSSECQLNTDEALWLDPGRGITDEGFARDLARDDWRESVCKNFALWLNQQLKTDRVTFGDDAHQHWAKSLARELKMIRQEVGLHD